MLSYWYSRFVHEQRWNAFRRVDRVYPVCNWQNGHWAFSNPRGMRETLERRVKGELRTSVSSSKYLGRNSLVFRSVSMAITSIEFRMLEFNACSAACNWDNRSRVAFKFCSDLSNRSDVWNEKKPMFTGHANYRRIYLNNRVFQFFNSLIRLAW